MPVMAMRGAIASWLVLGKVNKPSSDIDGTGRQAVRECRTHMNARVMNPNVLLCIKQVVC